jgi:hypothetical protein
MRNAILLLPLMLAACAQPFEGRVASRLVEAGLPRSMADCMAQRWVDRLSLLQLQKISDLAETLKEERGRLTPIAFVTRVRELGDPEIVQVVTSSSVVCALSG